MNRIVTITFLFLFLAINSTYGQALLLPTLVHHYLEHAEWDHSSFVKFLNDHYARTIQHPDDQHADHEQLPFKAIHSHVAPTVAPVPPLQIVWSQAAFETIQEHSASYHPGDYANAYLNSIWQPPCMG